MKTKPIIIVLSIIFILSLSLTLITSNDIWWHLKTGEVIIDEKHIPTEDIFSHSAEGHHWILHEWVSQVLFYLIFAIGGFYGLIIFKGILFLLIGFLSYKTIEEKPLYLKIFILIFVFLALRSHSLMRPHIIAWVLISLTLYLLKKEKLWWLPLVILAWANTHGSVILGLVIIAPVLGWKFLKEKKLKYLGVGLASLIASTISPGGINSLIYPFKVKFFFNYITEWMPAETSSWYFIVFISFFIIIITSLIFSFKKYRLKYFQLPYFILFLLFTYLAFSARRNMAIAALVFVPIAATHLGVLLKNHLNRTKLKDIILIIILLSLTIFFITAKGGFKLGYNDREYNDAIPDLITENNLKNNIANDIGLGGFLEYKLYPEYKLFIDGRIVMYGEEIFFDYLYLKNGKNYSKLIKKYNIKTFVNSNKAKINSILSESPDWKLIYFDDFYSVFTIKEEDITDLTPINPYLKKIPKTQEEAEQVIELYNYLLDLNPNIGNVHKNIGFLYYSLKDSEKAKYHLEKYLDIKPKGQNIEAVKEMLKKL